MRSRLCLPHTKFIQNQFLRKWKWHLVSKKKYVEVNIRAIAGSPCRATHKQHAEQPCHTSCLSRLCAHILTGSLNPEYFTTVFSQHFRALHASYASFAKRAKLFQTLKIRWINLNQIIIVVMLHFWKNEYSSRHQAFSRTSTSAMCRSLFKSCFLPRYGI